jgi:hypothetical protein
MRKLLPYEYQLIEQLGISKEEYLEFIAVQAAYNDVKIGTVLDVRGLPVVAAALSIVGMIFSVASTLLRPKPKITTPQGVSVGTPVGAPTEGIGGQAQTREQRFSPRFGFNGQQDLAKYGDPINLIYCNTDINPKGAVRAATSLVWSAVRSYGSSQFVQLLLVLGAGRIANINADKSAFGQVALEDLVAQNKFFYHNNQSTGLLTWNDEDYGRASSDPTFYGTGINNPYRLQRSSENTRVDGFSQAYSPGTQNAFGVYGIVPINTLVYQRNENGDKISQRLGITATYSWLGGQSLDVGQEITVTIDNTKDNFERDVDFMGQSDLFQQAQETRRTLATAFDASGIFKLGSAVFKVISIDAGSPDEQNMNIKLRCIESGFAPYAAYLDLIPPTVTNGNASQVRTDTAYVNAVRILNNLIDRDSRQARRITGQIDGGGFTYEYLDYSFANIVEGTHPSQNTAPGAEQWEFATEIINNSLEITQGSGLWTAEYAIAIDPDNGAESAYFTGYYVKRRDITEEERAAYLFYKNAESTITGAESLFFTKALARAESASYRTIQQCNIVDFAIKSRVFKRISGRQERYGKNNHGGYPISDNGIKNRVAMFLFKYRKAGEPSFAVAPLIIAVSRAGDIDNFNYIKFASTSATADYWEFKLESIAETFAEIRKHPELRLNNGSTNFLYLESSPNAVTITLPNVGTLQAAGRLINSSQGFPPLNESPRSIAEWDLFNLDADSQCQFSFEAGPEFALTCVTEQQIQSFSGAGADNKFPNLYKNLSMVGLNLYSGRNLQDLRSFTAFVTKGRVSTLLDGGGVGCAAHAPDIFLDTIVDSEDGIGKYAKIEGIDSVQLAKSKRFCRVNKLFMDGIIADTTNWRQFWVDVAPFSLLEFARIGGRETLIPAVPYDENTGAMNRIVNVTALFNQGNIMEGSYKEEHLDYGSSVQDLIATIVYRGADVNGTFSANRAIEVKIANTSEIDAVRETFYVAQFVSTREQAIIYGKFLCQIRRHIKVAIEFKTFPTMDPVSPGAFVYVDIGQNSWDGIRTGIIGPGGALNIPLDNSLIDGSYEFLLYQSGKGVISRTATTTANIAATLADLNGYLFVLGQKTTTRRVFRVTEVEMDEEGEITVRGTNYPCTSDGLSEIANFDDGIFTVAGALD